MNYLGLILYACVSKLIVFPPGEGELCFSNLHTLFLSLWLFHVNCILICSEDLRKEALLPLFRDVNMSWIHLCNPVYLFILIREKNGFVFFIYILFSWRNYLTYTIIYLIYLKLYPVFECIIFWDVVEGHYCCFLAFLLFCFLSVCLSHVYSNKRLRKLHLKLYT